ncbi:GIY-YIG nuclease family protein [Companilactobacillus furfuricola]|uniref:GIY-YIG nuclease family protein n=1 Tax=Companilactobacillus furfuricola TaxID=1462575 RepID=UPI000F78D8D6|nr:GIY-YIG nuclease family protein [Companilactobacillus furfuricola]
MSETNEGYFVYMLLCADGTFYTGTSNDVYKRVKTHNRGKGAKYTKVRRPVRLLYQERLHDKSEALKREAAIKKLGRKQKEQLLRNHGISWD